MPTSTVEFRRPGVTVQEVPLPRDTGTVTGTVARAVIVGYLERGPETPTVVSSWLQFQALYGAWTNSAENNRTVDSVYAYFANASASASSLIVQRVVKSGAAVAHVAVKDGTGSEAVTLFTLNAISVGDWGNRLHVEITNTAGSLSGEFDPSEFDPGAFLTGEVPTGGTFNISVTLKDDAGNVVGTPEGFYNLSMSDLARNYYATTINNSSKYVRVVPATGLTTLNPPAATTTPTALTGGLDSSGSSPTLGVSTALGALDVIEAPLAIYLASYGTGGDPNSSHTALAVNYAEQRGDSFVVADTPRTGAVSTIISAATAISSKSAYAAVYYPWIAVSDPLRSSTSVLKTIPPGASVLGAMMNTDAAYGPWRSPAGAVATLRNAVAVDVVLSESDLAQLNSANSPVNAIRNVSGVGVCVMGARTLDPTNADRYVGIRRSLNFITVNLKNIAESSVFEPNGTDLWERLRTQMNNWLGLYFQQGALRGAREPDAFQVVIDETNNTAATIAAGELHIDVGVAVEYPAEFIVIRLTQHQGSIRS